ncbi:unnamed protein product, partial [Amoebophrya sp. A25]|eukprot:GSA25T00010688001.1
MSAGDRGATSSAPEVFSFKALCDTLEAETRCLSRLASAPPEKPNAADGNRERKWTDGE